MQTSAYTLLNFKFNEATREQEASRLRFEGLQASLHRHSTVTSLYTSLSPVKSAEIIKNEQKLTLYIYTISQLISLPPPAVGAGVCGGLSSSGDGEIEDK